MKERKIVFFSLILQNFGTVHVVEQSLYNIKNALITCVGSSATIDYINYVWVEIKFCRSSFNKRHQITDSKRYDENVQVLHFFFSKFWLLQESKLPNTHNAKPKLTQRWVTYTDLT